MTETKNNGVKVIGALLLLILGATVYCSFSESNKQKQKKILKEEFSALDFGELFYLENKPYSSFVVTTNELRTILLDSIDDIVEKNTFKYPIAVCSLLRSSLEQSIKVYLQSCGKTPKNSAAVNEKRMLDILANNSNEMSSNLKEELEKIRTNEIRTKLNHIIHEPDDISTIQKELEKMSGVLRFIKNVAEQSSDLKRKNREMF